MSAPDTQYANLQAIDVARLGLEHAQSRRVTAARDALEHAIAKAPDDVAVNHTVGVILRTIDQQDEALRYFEKALEIDSRFFFSHVEIAHIFMAKGQPVEALDWFKRPIAEGVNWHVPYEKAGLLASFLGRHDEAVHFIEQACHLVPDDERLRENAEACRQAGLMAQRTLELNLELASVRAVSVGRLPDRQISPNSIWLRVRVVRVEVFPRSGAAFDEVVETIAFAMRNLGATVDIAFNQPLEEHGINIFVGAHMIEFCPGFPTIPDSSIILNLEPYGSPAFQYSKYRILMHKFPIWEYSQKNLSLIRNDIPNVIKFEIGYMERLSRIPFDPQQDIDVLFYGSLNVRRRNILTQLEAAGLVVVYAFGKFGHERDIFIKRSKIVLNIHFYDDSIFEIVRISYLLSNHKAVVCEVGSETEVPEDLRAAVVACSYDKLVATCVQLIQSDHKRSEAAKRGYDLFTRRDQAALISETIAATKWPSIPT